METGKDFDETLYRSLRDYQDGKFTGANVGVGQLTPQLTAIYDAVREMHHGSIDMILPCPSCGTLHVDAPEPDMCKCGHRKLRHNGHHYVCNEPGEDTDPIYGGALKCKCLNFTVAWDNPPHKSHLCHGCGIVWRPADVPTNGVAEIKTRGEKDTWPVAKIPKCLECSANATTQSGGIWRCDFHHDRQPGRPPILG